MSGHAIHFLERLKRTDGGQSKLALELYHRPELLRLILSMIDPPKKYERVAISLDSEDKGPFVVTTREGKFVTCLGKDMRIDNLYLIAQKRFQTFLDRVEKLGKRAKFLPDTMDELDEGLSIDDIIFTKGAAMSREDFLALSVLQPALRYEYLAKLVSVTEKLSCIQEGIMQKNPPKGEDRHLRAHWNHVYALGHMTAMTSMFGPQGLEPYVDWNRSGLYPFYPAFHTGQISIAARALFAAGRMGKYALQVCKEALRKPHSTTMWLFALMGIVVIGLRHNSLKTQAEKLLKKYITKIPPVAVPYAKKLGSNYFDALHTYLIEPIPLHDSVAADFKKILFKKSQQYNYQPPYNFKTADDVPENLAFANNLNILGDFRNTPHLATVMAYSLFWLSRIEAEDLYLPRGIHQCFPMNWQPGFTKFLVDNDMQWYGKKLPMKKENQAKRNDPCPCGAGKKYKKCCLKKEGPPIPWFFGREIGLGVLYKPQNITL